MKQQINFRASKITKDQIDALIVKTGMNLPEIVSIAIDRMFREETMNIHTANFAMTVTNALDERGNSIELVSVADFDSACAIVRGMGAKHIEVNGKRVYSAVRNGEMYIIDRTEPADSMALFEK
jgi:hypothetical protein